jgi:hypothetical protein
MIQRVSALRNEMTEKCLMTDCKETDCIDCRRSFRSVDKYKKFVNQNESEF